jgi:hypothetical protein
VAAPGWSQTAHHSTTQISLAPRQPNVLKPNETVMFWPNCDSGHTLVVVQDERVARSETRLPLSAIVRYGAASRLRRRVVRFVADCCRDCVNPAAATPEALGAHLHHAAGDHDIA